MHEMTYDHSLGHITVIQDGLDDIVSVAVSKQLFESRSVQDFSHQSLSDLGVCHSDALFDDIR